MPVSVTNHLHEVLQEVHRLQPSSVLELGIGFGKYGALVRETLDGWYGRCRPDQWQTRIVGVEVFSQYKNPCWHCYNTVFELDFVRPDSLRPLLWAGWGLAMMMDSLEHLTPEVGRPFLAELVKNNKHVIISVPNGRMPQDEAVFGNAHERHLWTFNGLEEFARFDNVKLLHQSICTVVSIEGLA